MLLLPLREIDVFGVFVTPAAPLLVVCLCLAATAHFVSGWFDLNRYVWNRPLFDVALFIAFYATAVLTLQGMSW